MTMGPALRYTVYRFLVQLSISGTVHVVFNKVIIVISIMILLHLVNVVANQRSLSAFILVGTKTTVKHPLLMSSSPTRRRLSQL